MSKVSYNGIKFDSDLEINYYKLLQELMEKKEVIRFTYHPKQIPNFAGKRAYTPDFIVEYPDRIEIVETKGFNAYSKLIDDTIHTLMQQKSLEWLQNYVGQNGYDSSKNTIYKKIKYLQRFGFVDFDFKNPNTLANQRKAKIDELEQENKELRTFKREAIRYITYLKKSKLTKRQEEFKLGFEEKLQEEM